MDGATQKQKAHHKPQSGPKADKKKFADKKKRGLTTERHNPKVQAVAIYIMNVLSAFGLSSLL
jgi:hypothetical protein